jgi:hypothetical protein
MRHLRTFNLKDNHISPLKELERLSHLDALEVNMPP